MITNEKYTFCEGPHATTMSREHIREVVDGWIYPSGGIGVPARFALCGFSVEGGWDQPGHVTDKSVDVGLTLEVNPTCPKCAAIWKAR